MPLKSCPGIVTSKLVKTADDEGVSGFRSQTSSLSLSLFFKVCVFIFGCAASLMFLVSVSGVHALVVSRGLLTVVL